MSKLAQEYGLSDRGLAKLCSRHRILVPPRGYWAKLSAGVHVTKPPFLELRDRSLDQVTIRNPVAARPSQIVALVNEKKAERRARAINGGDVAPKPAAPTVPQRSITATVRYLQSRKPNEDGRIAATGQGHCGVVVHRDSVERAVQILTSLADALAGADLPLEPGGDKMSVRSGPDSISFTLTERTKRSKYVPTPEEVEREERRKEKRSRALRRNDWSSIDFGYSKPWPDYVTVFTGELIVSIDAWAEGLRKTWGDVKIQRVERMLPDMVAGIELVLTAERVRREEREERERRWAELQSRRLMAKARAEREEKRTEYLGRILRMKKEAEEIRSWLDSLAREDRPAANTDIERMIAWTRERLAHLELKSSLGAVVAALEGKTLFPEPDDLHDPLGEPPPQSRWW
jgi:hypothetical protein